MSEPQTYATHRRWDPVFHYFLMPVLLLTAGATVWHLIKTPSLQSAWIMVLAFALFMLAFKIRAYALHVQDRLIRMEETMRMGRVLPEDLKSRIPELTGKQMVGLRFAADAELADRVREALVEKLGDEAIKKRIQTWRPDTFRV